MEIENFQGCKELTIEPNGKDLKIYGENEAGKSTIASAWTWLLFDKNIHNQSTQKFDIKPLDENNEPIHHLETMVKATIKINNSQKTFRKIYYEDWKKKRGSSKKQFSGHKTDCYVSNVPVKKKEFEKEINDLAKEEVFRLLTDPLYFNQELHWKERRNILLDIKNVTTDEIVEENNDLENITKILIDDDAEKTRKALKDKKDKLEEDKEEIPTRIDEKYKGLPDVDDLDSNEIKEEIEELKGQKKNKEQELNRIENGGEVAEKEKKLAQLDTELQKLENEHTGHINENISELREEIEEIKDQIREKESKIKDKKQNIKNLKNNISNNEKKMDDLREEFKKLKQEKKDIDNQQFDESEFETVTCPKCNNEFALEDTEKHKKQFRKDKAESIKKKTERQNEINKKGKELSAENEELEVKIKQLESEINEIGSTINDLHSKKSNINKKINDLQQTKSKIYEFDKYKEKLEEKEKLKQQINELRNGNNQEVGKLQVEINGIEEDIENKKDKLKEIQKFERGKERIKELEKEEEKLAEKIEELERKMYMCEQYEKTRAELLEEKVNGMFDMAEFVLFEKQINGGIKPTCKTVYKGVPFNTNLNSGHRTLVGVDIINNLSEYYGFRAPIFADNAESITEDIETDGQLIELIAKKGVEELEILEGDQELVWDDKKEDWIIKKEEK